MRSGSRLSPRNSCRLKVRATLADEQLDIVAEAAAALGMDGQDVLLDGQIDRDASTGK